MGMGLVLQHCDTPHEHARTLSVNGGMKKNSDGSTLILCVGGVRVDNPQNQEYK
jgi:hypothetical protein